MQMLCRAKCQASRNQEVGQGSAPDNALEQGLALIGSGCQLLVCKIKCAPHLCALPKRCPVGLVLEQSIHCSHQFMATNNQPCKRTRHTISFRNTAACHDGLVQPALPSVCCSCPCRGH